MAIELVEKSELSKALKDINFIRVKYEGSELLDISPVFFSTEDTIDIILNGDRKDEVQTGLKTVVKFEKEGYEYIVDGEIINIDDYSPPTVSIKVCDAKKFQNKRKDIRYETNMKSSLTGLDGSVLSECIIKNISRGGAGILCAKDDLDSGEGTLYIDVSRGKNLSVKLKAKILRKMAADTGKEKGGQMFSYGMQFMDVTHEQYCRLDKIISNIVEGYQKLILDSASAMQKGGMNLPAGHSNIVLLSTNDEDIAQVKECLKGIDINEINILQNIVFLVTYLETEKPKILMVDIDGYDNYSMEIIRSTAYAYPEMQIFLALSFDEDAEKVVSGIGAKNIELLYKPFIYSEVQEKIMKYL